MDNQNLLELSESFYSMQCEGVTTGVPSFFLRMKGCSLECGCSTQQMKGFIKNGIEETPGGFSGDLEEQGKATWTCDTIPVWIKGKNQPFQYIIDQWKELDILEWVKQGRVHLIWTGGEPTIPKHQTAINNFIEWFVVQYNGEDMYNEIETNGTIYMRDNFFSNMDQINCSVKLANSGMEKKRRIIPQALERIMSHSNYWFKFVISTEDDMKEIEEDFVKPFNINPKRVILMPGLDGREDFHERTRFSLEMGKKYGYIGLTRLHISSWDRACGV